MAPFIYLYTNNTLRSITSFIVLSFQLIFTCDPFERVPQYLYDAVLSTQMVVRGYIAESPKFRRLTGRLKSSYIEPIIASRNSSWFDCFLFTLIVYRIMKHSKCRPLCKCARIKIDQNSSVWFMRWQNSKHEKS